MRSRDCNAITPRPYLIVAAAAFTAVAMPGAVALVMLANNGFRVEGTPATRLGEIILWLGTTGIVISWPIGLLLWRLARQSVLANVAGLLGFIATASIFPTFSVAGHSNWASRIELFVQCVPIFAIYGVVSVGIAATIERSFRRRKQLSDIRLTDTFE